MQDFSHFTLRSIVLLFALLSFFFSQAQYSSVVDDFEGSGTITSWEGDDCQLDSSFPNPVPGGINMSPTVLRYGDVGGTYANIRFTNTLNFNMGTGNIFSFKLYVPSGEITGNAPLQVSLKLQNGYQPSAWTSQSEIIKSIVLDEWQTVTFDFSSGQHLNYDAGSGSPTERVDFNRIIIQVNGENNADEVTAYIDDFEYDGLIGYDPDQSESVYNHLVWSDEFEGAGVIDSDKWHHQTQIPNPWGWFNGEQQHYTDNEENSYLSDGLLHIVAKRQDYVDQGLQQEFTSARLNSKFAFTYGRVEARARLPQGDGTWPAIWMLGKNVSEIGGFWYPEYGTTAWPACGEIDIMEHWGWNQHYVSSALHTPSSSGATENYGGLYAVDVSNEFHIYGMEWTEEEIRFTVDGQVHYSYQPAQQNAATWPYFEDQYLILNVAIEEGVDASFQESEMELDYIRVYQQAANSVDEVAAAMQESIAWTIDGELLNIENYSSYAADLSIYDIQGRLLSPTEAILPGRQTIALVNATGPLMLHFNVNGTRWADRLLR
jgi:beta-glucanase (GH16 family)